MDTLPRFRLPDESSSRDVSRAAAAWEDFDDLDQLETRLVEKNEAPRENEFDVIPTVVRPSLGRKVITRAALVNAKPANVDDVVEELRAAAAGQKPRVRELASTDLLDEEGADGTDEIHLVDPRELLVDREVPQRDVWNVRHVARGAARPSIVGPTTAPTSRFILTAAAAMLGGALLAIAVAFLVWRFSGVHL